MTELAREIAEQAAHALNLGRQYDLCTEALTELRVVQDEDEPIATQKDLTTYLARPAVVRAWTECTDDAPTPLLVVAPRLQRVGIGSAPTAEEALYANAPVTPQRLVAAFNDRKQDLWEPELFSWEALWSRYSPRVLNNGQAVGWSAILLFADKHDPRDPTHELSVPGLVYGGMNAGEQRRALATERARHGESLDVATVAEVVVAYAMERVLLRRHAPPSPEVTHMPEPEEFRRLHNPVKRRAAFAPRRALLPPPEEVLPNSSTLFPQYGARRPSPGSKPMVPALCLEDGQLRLSGFPGDRRGGGGIRRGIRLA